MTHRDISQGQVLHNSLANTLRLGTSEMFPSSETHNRLLLFFVLNKLFVTCPGDH